MSYLTRFEKRPYWDDGEHSDWWNILEIPLYDPPNPMWDDDLPKIVVEAVLADEAGEIVDALNNAFNLGREFSRQR